MKAIDYIYTVKAKKRGTFMPIRKTSQSFLWESPKSCTPARANISEPDINECCEGIVNDHQKILRAPCHAGDALR